MAGLFASSLAGYYVMNIVLAFMGQQLSPLVDPAGILIMGSIFAAVGGFGVLIRRIWLPFLIVGAANTFLVTYAALHSVGPLLPGIRQIVGAVILPLVCAVMLTKVSSSLKFYEKANERTRG